MYFFRVQSSKLESLWQFMALKLKAYALNISPPNTWLGRDLTTVHMQLVQKYSHQKSPNLYYTKAMHRVQTTSPNLIALIPYFSSLIHFDSTRRGFTQDHLPRVARFRESRGSFEAKILCKNWEDFNTLHRSLFDHCLIKLDADTGSSRIGELVCCLLGHYTSCSFVAVWQR